MEISCRHPSLPPTTNTLLSAEMSPLKNNGPVVGSVIWRTALFCRVMVVRLQRLQVGKINQDDVAAGAGEYGGAAIRRHQELIYRRENPAQGLCAVRDSSFRSGPVDIRRTVLRVGQRYNVDVRQVQRQNSCPVGQGADVRRSGAWLHVDDTVGQVGAVCNRNVEAACWPPRQVARAVMLAVEVSPARYTSGPLARNASR